VSDVSAMAESGQRTCADEPAVVAVLTAADEPMPPGLDALAPVAAVRHVHDRQGLAAGLSEADVLVVTDFRTSLLRDVWPKRPSVRWVHATSAGVDRLLFPALIESDIPVTNARGIFDTAIAEFVLGQVLVFAKDFHTSIELKRLRQWRHRETERIEGRQALIIGAGSIGRRIAQLLQAVGMHTRGVASARRQDPVFGTVHAVNTLHELLPEADFVVIAVPLTEATRALFGAAEFSAMPSHARLINIARGPIVVTDDLVVALRRGDIAGAALDVFEQEPLPEDHPLYELPQVIVTAHMAGDFVGWRQALTQQFLDNFERWRHCKPLRNVVDKQRGYVPPYSSHTVDD
jgi:phosphoglycerate dehydrogenase-like enzyme